MISEFPASPRVLYFLHSWIILSCCCWGIWLTLLKLLILRRALKSIIVTFGKYYLTYKVCPNQFNKITYNRVLCLIYSGMDLVGWGVCLCVCVCMVEWACITSRWPYDIVKRLLLILNMDNKPKRDHPSKPRCEDALPRGPAVDQGIMRSLADWRKPTLLRGWPA